MQFVMLQVRALLHRQILDLSIFWAGHYLNLRQTNSQRTFERYRLPCPVRVRNSVWSLPLALHSLLVQ